jgi:hypothetical protein
MPADLTAYDKILKEVYVPAVREQMQKATILLSQVQRTSENITGEGKYAVIALMLGYNEGIGARGDNEALPEAKNVRYDKILIPIRTTYGKIQVTGKTIRQTKSDAGAFVRAIDSEMKNMVTGLKRDINRQLFGDGTGTLGKVVGNQTGVNTIVVNSTQYFRVGMLVDIHESTPITNREIVGIGVDNSGNPTITISGTAVNVTDGTIITRAGSKDKEMYGLTNIVNTTNWLLDPANVPEWKASVRSLPANYTSQQLLDTLQSAFSDCEQYGEEAPNLIVTTYAIRDKYASALTTLRRVVNTLDLEFGFKGLEFNGVPIVPDNQCPEGVLYMLNTKHLLLSTASDFDWADEDGRILTKVAGYDAYYAYMYFDANFACDRRNCFAKVIGW